MSGSNATHTGFELREGSRMIAERIAPPAAVELGALRLPHVRHAGAGRGWWVVGPGRVAGVSQTVALAGPYTRREQAERRAAWERGRHDARTLPLRRDELAAVRILARQASTRELRAYWLGVRWEGSRP